MASKRGTFNSLPSPDPKYPFVGPNYQGEQNGFIYYPWGDYYYADPAAESAYQQATGTAPEEPKEPGLWDTLGPVAGAAGAYALASGAMENPGAFYSGLTDAAGDIFSTGSELVSGAADTVGGLFGPATANASPVTGGTGLFGLGGAPAIAGEGISASAPYGVMTDAAGNAIGTMAPPAGGGLFSLGGIGSAGNAILPAAGAYGFHDLFSGGSENLSPGSGAIQGAASGAAIGSYFGPVGAGIGAVAGGMIGLGKSLFGDKDTWKKEKNALQGLVDQGIYVPQGLIDSMPTKGRKKEELIRKDLPTDFVGRDNSGNWVNNKFAQSRNEADLTGVDVVNFSAWAENDPDWFRKPLEQRIQIAQQAVDAGAVNEHHGTIDVDFSKFSQAPGAPQAQQQQAPQQKPESVPPPQVPPPQQPPQAQTPPPPKPAPGRSTANDLLLHRPRW